MNESKIEENVGDTFAVGLVGGISAFGLAAARQMKRDAFAIVAAELIRLAGA